MEKVVDEDGRAVDGCEIARNRKGEEDCTVEIEEKRVNGVYDRWLWMCFYFVGSRIWG